MHILLQYPFTTLMLQEVKLKAFISLMSVNEMDFLASFPLIVVLDAPAFCFSVSWLFLPSVHLQYKLLRAGLSVSI